MMGQKGHVSQIVLSLHLEQTSPVCASAILVAANLMNISSDLVIGFPIYQANRRNVALPI